MKLSAPPPPPPEPPEQPDPEENQSPADPEPATPDAPAAKPAPKQATWPAWFGGLDAALAVLVAVLAFLVASFAARNSDLWVHLAAGRMLTTGEYKLGSDPLSFAAADRAWVNHSWLFDLAAFLLYSGTGATLVVLKALAVAASAALLMALRRGEHALWPWAAAAALFVLAAAPRLNFGPYVGSVFFLALTLFLVFKLPPKRLPLAVGVTFWLWANTDPWFVLGPLLLLLLLVGEFIQAKFLKSEEVGPGDPLGPVPAVPVLARALLVGVVACMLNPHHVRVWEVPFELIGSDAARRDSELAQLLLTGPLDARFRDSSTFGSNVNGLAYAVLLVSGGVLLGFGVGRLRVSHVVLWVGFAALSLLSMYAIPFFAVVAVPFVASQLNAITTRVKLGTTASPGTRMVLFGSAIGRVVSFALLAGLCAVAWPGWLHPQVGEPGAVRRVAWVVEADPALARAAAQLKTWREKGDLPADARGLSANVQFANYCAWFAPGEKVFVNSRFNHHKPELADFAALRLALGVRSREAPPEAKEAAELLEKHGAEFVVTPYRIQAPAATATLLGAADQWAVWLVDGQTVVFGRRAGRLDAVKFNPAALVFGTGAERPPAGKLVPPPAPRDWADEFARPVRPVPPDVDEAYWLIQYKQMVAQRDAAKMYQLRLLMSRNVVRTPAMQLPGDLLQMAGEQDIRNLLARQPKAAASLPVLAPWAEVGYRRALPILAIRAARRAITANPDHPDAYAALANCYADPDLPLTEAERSLGRLTALRQCLARFPSPEEYTRLRKEYGEGGRRLFFASPTKVAKELANLIAPQIILIQMLPPNAETRVVAADRSVCPELGVLLQGMGGNPFELQRLVFPVRQQIPREDGRVETVLVRREQWIPANTTPPDVARQLLLKALEYAAVEYAGLAGAEAEDERKQITEALKTDLKAAEEDLRRRKDKVRRDEERVTTPAERFRLARAHDLTGDALAVLNSPALKDEGALIQEFGNNLTGVLLERVALEMATGQIEDAADDIAVIKARFDSWTQQIPENGRRLLRQVLRQLEYHKMMLEGDYAAAGAEWEAIGGRDIGLDAILDELAKVRHNLLAKPSPTPLPPGPPPPVKALDALDVAWPHLAMLGSLSPLDAASLHWGGMLQYENFATMRNLLAQKLRTDATFFFRRGFLALMEGDVAAAKERFKQSTRQPPPGWEMTPTVLPVAEEYLRLIEFAQMK